MKSIHTVVMSALLLGLSAPALAGGKKPETHPISLSVSVRVQTGTASTNSILRNTVVPASGLRVGLFYDRNLFGVPRVFKVATTDTHGRVSFRFDAREDKPLQLQIKTESSNARVGQGLFLRTHERSVRLAQSETARSTASKVVTFSRYAQDTFTRAVTVQDFAQRTGVFARRAFRGVLSRYNRIVYSFPGMLGSSSYAPFSNRAVIKDRAYDRSLEVVGHETFHCFWYQARGKLFEYYPPYTHSPAKRSGNPSLAASEGWATAMMLEAVRDMARRKRLPVPRNTSNWRFGEDHPLLGTTPATWRAWGQDNEGNVECAITDLIDTTRDRGAVDPSYYDDANGGDIPSGEAAIRAIYVGIKATRGTRPSFLNQWTRSLRATFKSGGYSACRANGIPVPR